MSASKLRNMYMDFYVDIINLVKHLKSQHETVISNPIGRSGMLFTDKNNIHAQKCYQKCGFNGCEELSETMSDNTEVERYKMACKF